MKNNLHPENLKEVNAIKTEQISEYVKKLSNDVEDEDAGRKKWKEQVDKLQKLRFGVRAKKTHPWPGCANYSIPVIDSDINRIKPMYINSVFGVSPIVKYEPYGAEDVEAGHKRELLMDWRLRTKVKPFKAINIAVDQILGAQGQTVFRIIWKYKTRKYTQFLDIADFPVEVQEAIYDIRMTDDLLAKIIIEEFKINDALDENIEEVKKTVEKFRAGEAEIEMSLLEKEDDQPELIACDVKDDLVVPWGTKDIQDARFIDYQFLLSKNDILIAMRDEKYNKFDESEIDAWITKDAKVDESSLVDEMILVHETCCWYDIDGDGIDERCIATWPDSDATSVLRFIEVPYAHGKFPYVQVKREIIEDWFYSTRGVAHLIEDFQNGISTSINQAIDNGTITNTPVILGRKGILSNPRNRRYVPGEYIETNGPTTDYEMRTVGNASQGFLFQQAQYLKSWVDNRLGQMTSGLGSMTDMPGMGERGKKTKAEVDTLMALQGQAQSLDLIVFQQQMVEVYEQIDALYNQYGDDEEEILITNQQPIKISREEIQGKFNLTPNGRVDNNTPAVRLQKAMYAFQIGAQNPLVKQDELLREIFKDIDPRYSDRFIKTPQEIQQEQQQAQQMAQIAEADALEKQLTVKQLVDNTDVRKAAMLEPIEGKKFAAG